MIKSHVHICGVFWALCTCPSDILQEPPQLSGCLKYVAHAVQTPRLTMLADLSWPASCRNMLTVCVT